MQPDNWTIHDSLADTQPLAALTNLEIVDTQRLDRFELELEVEERWFEAGARLEEEQTTNATSAICHRASIAWAFAAGAVVLLALFT